MLLTTSIGNVSDHKVVLTPRNDDYDISALTSTGFSQYGLSHLRVKFQTHIEVQTDCFTAAGRFLITATGQTVQVFNASKCVFKQNMGFRVTQLFAFQKQEHKTIINKLDEYEEGEQVVTVRLEQDDYYVLEIFGDSQAVTIQLDTEWLGCGFEIDDFESISTDLTQCGPFKVIQYDFEHMLLFGIGLISIYNRLSRQIVAQFVVDSSNSRLLASNEAVNNHDELEQILMVSTYDRYCAVLQRSQIVFLNLKSTKSPFVTLIQTGSFFTETPRAILLTKANFYAFFDQKYYQIDLKTKLVVCEQKFPENVLPIDNPLLSVHDIPVMDKEDCFLITHRSGFMIYQNNSLRKQRQACGQLDAVMFKSDNLTKSSKDDQQLIAFGSVNQRCSLVDQRNGYFERDFSCTFKNNLKTCGNYVFGVAVNENGDQLVQMYDYLKHQKIHQQYVSADGRVAKLLHQRDIRKRFGALDYQFELERSADYSKYSFGDAKQADIVSCYCVDNDHICVVTSSCMSIFTVQSGTIVCGEVVKNRFSSACFTALSDVAASEEFTVKSDVKFDGQKFVVLCDTNGLMAVVGMNGKTRYQVNVFEALHLSGGCCDSVHVYQNVIAIVNDNQLVLVNYNFDNVALALSVKRIIDLHGLRPRNDKLLLRNTKLFFFDDYRLLEVSPDHAAIFMMGEFKQKITDFDVDEAGEQIAISLQHKCGFTVLRVNHSAVKVPIGFTIREVESVEHVNGNGIQLLEYIKMTKNNAAFRAEAQRVRRPKSFQSFGGIAIGQFITEKDIVFLSAEDLIVLIQQVQAEKDDIYETCVAYLIAKYKFKEVKQCDALKSMINGISKKKCWGQLADANRMLNALIEFVE